MKQLVDFDGRLWVSDFNPSQLFKLTELLDCENFKKLLLPLTFAIFERVNADSVVHVYRSNYNYEDFNILFNKLEVLI